MKGLKLPNRETKPRQSGINMILEKGMDLTSFESYVTKNSEYIDLLKFTSGLALVDKNIKEKIRICKQNDISCYVGGTLFEKYYSQNKVQAFFEFLKSLEISVLEISDGTIEVPDKEKINIMKQASNEGFEVLVEVGSKDQDFVMPPSKWIEQINLFKEEGAKYLILEGRESGSAGLYRKTGEIRTGLLEEIYNQTGVENIIFEAPNKNAQCYLINKFGTNVNMGNIPLSEVLILEVQRLGLRYETFHL